ncbi:MAG TPA: Ig-like domain-containing protein, partial [Gemmatimonadaceae bacterium]|nr:Ig-like domain-containing protein [Gemmatimonadaceae bacterium]
MGAIPGSQGLVVKADGASTISVQVSGATAGPITLTATQGTFASGTNRAEIPGTSGSADLTACDARTNSRCAGLVTITASDANGRTGRVLAKFVGFETACNDRADNNGDGRADCADSDCDQAACSFGGATGVCQGSVCVPPVCTPSSSAEICNNGIDEDCDGSIDCTEGSCDGQRCGTGSSNAVCRSGACTDASSGYGMTLKAARSRLPADGVAQTTVTATVTSNGTPASGVSVEFTTDLGDFGAGAGTSVSRTTGADGKASVTFRASAADGTATVHATLTASSAVTQSAVIVMPALGSIQLGSLLYPVMGVRHSGWNEQNQISVVVLDANQQPYPDGLAVRFQHQRLNGSTISTPWAADVPGSCEQANGCLAYMGQIASPTNAPDTTGKATVSLQSGTSSGLVSVEATVTAGGVTRGMTIPNIALVGAKASGARMSIDCTPRNLPALMSHDCVNSFYDGSSSPFHCTAFFADRFGNVLGRSVLVTFASEAGAAGQPVSTVSYDPSKGTDQTSRLGFAENSVAVTGFPLPDDVSALPAEPSATYTNACGARTHNPRDGLVSVIAMASGEEGFVDQNGNGSRDSSEPFIDQGEPFVDANDDGIWQAGEYFVDLNGNQTRDAPNGAWDSSTTIWAETRVLYSGVPAYGLQHSSATPSSVVLAAGTPPGTASVAFVFRDGNFNPLTPA